MNKRLDFIDFAKAYAILSIILYHFLKDIDLPHFVKMATWFGGTGIHLFFFLSGFGLNLSNVETIKSFFKRRIFKVYFPYAVIIIVIAIVNSFIKIYPDTNLNIYLSHLLLYKAFSDHWVNSLGGHFWFISTIIEFYLIFPIIKILSNRFNDFMFVLLSALASFIYIGLIIYFDLYKRIYLSVFILYLWEFALGMMLAKKYKQNGFSLWEAPIWIFIIVSIVSLASMALLTLHPTVGSLMINDIPAFFGYSSLCVIFYQLIKKTPGKLMHSILLISTFSYSIYLVHMLVYDSIQFFMEKQGYTMNIYYIIAICSVTVIFARYFQDMTSKLLNHIKL